MKFFALVFLAPVFLALAGCSTIAEKIVEPPKVRLDHIEVTDVGLTEATVLFDLLITNPNDFELKVDSIKYDLDIGEKRMGGGTLDKGAKVAAKGQKIIKFPVPVKYTKALSSVVGFVANGKSKYHVAGEAKFGPLTIPFDKTGDLEFEKKKK